MKKTVHIMVKTAVLTGLLLAALVSCKKVDIQPEPVGKPVPYTGPDKTCRQLIAQSPYTFFKAAWQRSHMDTLLAKYGSAYYSYFVPTDKAFQDEGWTMDKINAAAPENLDTLLSNCTVAGLFLPESIASMKASQSLRTLAVRNDLPNYNSWDRYISFLFVARHGDNLVINGNSFAKWGTGMEGTNGMIYPVDKMIQRPEKTMWQYLTEDDRFSFFTAAMLINDSLYQSDYLYVSSLGMLQSMPNATQTTLFAPTNAAFIKNGFLSVDDIRNYCQRTWPLPPAENGPDNYYHEPVTAMDSLLLPHGLQMYRLSGYNNNTGPVYFTNDLLDNAADLSGLVLVAGQPWSYPPLRLDLSFSIQNGEPMVRRYGSTAAPTRLSEKNIRVTNGVIHVVDDLFMP